MEHDTREFVTACPVYTQSKGSNKASPGLPHPWLVAFCPQSHIDSVLVRDFHDQYPEKPSGMSGDVHQRGNAALISSPESLYLTACTPTCYVVSGLLMRAHMWRILICSLFKLRAGSMLQPECQSSLPSFIISTLLSALIHICYSIFNIEDKFSMKLLHSFGHHFYPFL